MAMVSDAPEVETIEIDDECVDDASQFAKEWLAKMRTILQNYPAGPGSYLEDKMKTAADKARFATWLLETWPERPDICYHHDQVVPSVLEDELAQSPPLAIHVSSFSWTDGCGVKPAPGRDLALGLMAMYLKDGFITSGDVILMAQPLAVEKAAGLPSLWGSEESALKPFSLGYLKGRARLTSLFALLLSVFEEEVSLDDLKSFCPKLFDSVSVIWVQHMRQNSKEDEVLCNLKLSTRGSLRKAANLIQIAFMVRRLLASGGTDYTTFLRKYNQQSVAAHQLRGRKQTALKLLFESAPKDYLDFFFSYSVCVTPPLTLSLLQGKIVDKFFFMCTILFSLFRTCWMRSSTMLELLDGRIVLGLRRIWLQNVSSQDTFSQPRTGSGNRD